MFRTIAACFALLLLTVANPAFAGSQDQDCLKCHGTHIEKVAGSKNKPPFVDPARFSGSVHGGNGCVSCHSDLDGTKHPGGAAPQPVACGTCHDKPETSFNASVHGAARKAGNTGAANCVDCHGSHDVVPFGASASPVNRANVGTTCGVCHSDILKDYQDSIHGQAMAKGFMDAPTCIDCHGDHRIESLKNASSAKKAEEVCSRCHASQRMNAKFNLPTNRVSTFLGSYHGLAGRMGDKQTANCASCHGFHKILPSSDPRSTVNSANLAKTCQKCHPGSSENFALGKIHSDGSDVTGFGDKINSMVKSGYLLLIFATIGGMLFHNLLIFYRKAMAARRNPERVVVRMKPLDRLQHLLLATSFIYLVISGFALKFPDSWLTYLVGSSESFRRIGHRTSAIVMMVLSVAHVCYVLGTKDGRRFVKDMFPETKDALDVLRQFRHLLHPGAPRPKFGRFGYAEKAEYWAVVWGTFIMGSTGLMLWFKVYATQHLPRWVVDVALTVHLYEAILASLAILVWHFYFVIFDPDVYPLNWAVLDGKITRHLHHEEHPLETPTFIPGFEESEEPTEDPETPGEE
jgi:formate dehydrogenase gamma subunit